MPKGPAYGQVPNTGNLFVQAEPLASASPVPSLTSKTATPQESVGHYQERLTNTQNKVLNKCVYLVIIFKSTVRLNNRS